MFGSNNYNESRGWIISLFSRFLHYELKNTIENRIETQKCRLLQSRRSFKRKIRFFSNCFDLNIQHQQTDDTILSEIYRRYLLRLYPVQIIKFVEVGTHVVVNAFFDN